MYILDELVIKCPSLSFVRNSRRIGVVNIVISHLLLFNVPLSNSSAVNVDAGRPDDRTVRGLWFSLVSYDVSTLLVLRGFELFVNDARQIGYVCVGMNG